MVGWHVRRPLADIKLMMWRNSGSMLVATTPRRRGALPAAHNSPVGEPKGDCCFALRCTDWRTVSHESLFGSPGIRQDAATDHPALRLENLREWQGWEPGTNSGHRNQSAKRGHRPHT